MIIPARIPFPTYRVDRPHVSPEFVDINGLGVSGDFVEADTIKFISLDSQMNPSALATTLISRDKSNFVLCISSKLELGVSEEEHISTVKVYTYYTTDSLSVTAYTV